ncbi:protein brunelleschi-like [Varroa jacobsoni]|uniref:Trafficking protein particle complex subunit 9 n=1 Tax=Varroa destructor TaxID=109461 RepID=A0A7M7K0C3_VARDE|nr:protein brunelleschi-like [Varroa destructor]XP_022694032.1 protein brunelleschi-like [Varroa jacobsoni]
MTQSSAADYHAAFEDHSSVLVLVLCQRQDDLKNEAVLNVIRRIKKVRAVRSADVPGVSVKYVSNYSSKRNDWQQFQAHRAVRGVITVSEYRPRAIQTALNRHGDLVDPYDKTVLETRCIFVGKDVPSHPSESPVNEADCPNNLRREQCLFYMPDETSQLESDVLDFIANIVIVLRSTKVRLEQDVNNKKIDDKILIAPNEKREFVGIDVDSRQYRKRWLARNKKMLADISLQLGYVQEALALYSEAMDTFRAVGDLLWLGAVYEGQCAASAGHLQLPGKGGLVRNQSFPMRSRRNTPVSLSNPTLTHAGSCKSLPIDVDPIEAKQFGRDLLTLDEIVEKIREANVTYERFSHAVGPHIEVNLKLTRLLSLFERHLQAADYLQTAIVINCRLNENSWKYGWYDAVSQLYRDIGCYRKAAFYTRIGAVQAAMVHDGMKANNALCYQLMVKSLKGYQIDVSIANPYEGRRWHPFSTPEPVIGWSRLQTTLLNDVILTADRLPDGKLLAAHHCVYMLCYMFPFLEPQEAHQSAKKLDQLTAETGPLTLTSVSSELLDEPLPPIHLINYPLVTRAKPQVLAAEPVKWRSPTAASQPDGGTPFIWAPSKNNKNAARQPGIENGGIFKSKWVKGEVASVEMIIHNAASFALQITDFRLVTEGPFDCYPTSITVGPAEKGVATVLAVKIQGTPHSTGQVCILGYECVVLGVKTRCLFKDATWMHRKVMPSPYDDPKESQKNFEFIIDCVPELPLLEVLGDLQTDSNITVYAGQKKSYRVKLHNKSSVPVETIDIAIEGSVNVLVEWDEAELKEQLPVGPDATATFHVTLTGSENFLASQKSTDFVAKSSSAASSPLNTPRQRRFQSTPNTPHRNHNQLRVAGAVESSLNTVSTQMNILYSGGAGMANNYARRCSLKTRLTVLPSMVISQWDVLLADSATQCYLVLDIENRTSQEMDLEYQDGKSIVIEETCKIPVLIPRCKPSGGDEQLEELCRQHIQRHVKLRWSLSPEISGYANLNECKWSPAQVDTILSASLSCEIFLQRRLYNADDEFILKMGVPLSVQVETQNTSLCSLRQLLVSLRVYHDYQNKTIKLSDSVCFHGPQRIPIETIEPGEKVNVSFCLLFLFVGDYKIDVDCSTLSGDCARSVSSRAELGLRGTAACPKSNSSMAADGSEQDSSTAAAAGGASTTLARRQHLLWRSPSPIEITVVDLERDPLLSVPL